MCSKIRSLQLPQMPDLKDALAACDSCGFLHCAERSSLINRGLKLATCDCIRDKGRMYRSINEGSSPTVENYFGLPAHFTSIISSTHARSFNSTTQKNDRQSSQGEDSPFLRTIISANIVLRVSIQSSLPWRDFLPRYV
jgi:hypothetical protein